MGDSLQDQLKALGLAKDKPKPKHRRKPKQAAGKAAGKARRKPESDLERAYRLKAEAERAEGERTRREKMQRDARNRKINERLRAIVTEHAVNDAEAEGKRNFLDRGRIRFVPVTDEQNDALSDGTLGICYVAGRYFLLPARHLEAARKISAEHIVDLDAAAGDDEPDCTETPPAD